MTMQKLSQAGATEDGTIRCPKCGSTAFRSKRSLKGKLAAGLLAPKTRVKCEVCGKQFKRG